VYIIIIAFMGGSQIDFSSLIKHTSVETPTNKTSDPSNSPWNVPPPTFWQTVDLQPVPEPTPTPAPRVIAKFNMPRPETQEEIETTWLESPVTRSWEFDEKRGIWTTEKYEKSLQSAPSIIIGLREDGTVVWKKIK
jgi:hypothetical protein